MTKKSFRNPRADRPPLAFDLVYEVNTGSDDEPVWEERSTELHARMNIRGGLLVDITPPDRDDDTAVARFGKAIREAMTTIVVENDEFQRLMDDPEAVIQMSVLSDILNWAIEEASNRPTSGPRPS